MLNISRTSHPILSLSYCSEKKEFAYQPSTLKGKNLLQQVGGKLFPFRVERSLFRTEAKLFSKNYLSQKVSIALKSLSSFSFKKMCVFGSD